MRGEPLAGEEEVGLVKRDKSGNYPTTIGQLYYAVLVKIRPKNPHRGQDGGGARHGHASSPRPTRTRSRSATAG